MTGRCCVIPRVVTLSEQDCAKNTWKNVFPPLSGTWFVTKAYGWTSLSHHSFLKPAPLSVWGQNVRMEFDEKIYPSYSLVPFLLPRLCHNLLLQPTIKTLWQDSMSSHLSFRNSSKGYALNSNLNHHNSFIWTSTLREASMFYDALHMVLTPKEIVTCRAIRVTAFNAH